MSQYDSFPRSPLLIQLMDEYADTEAGRIKYQAGRFNDIERQISKLSTEEYLAHKRSIDNVR